MVENHPIESQSADADDEPAGDVAVPLDLTDDYGMKASDFDKVTQFPWPAVPRGSQKFANVPLEIGGMMTLWGERNAKNGLVFPEQITGIPVNRKFETLYVCQGDQGTDPRYQHPRSAMRNRRTAETDHRDFTSR